MVSGIEQLDLLLASRGHPTTQSEMEVEMVVEVVKLLLH